MNKLMGSHQALLKAFKGIYRRTSDLAKPKMRFMAMAAVIFKFEMQEIAD